MPEKSDRDKSDDDSDDDDDDDEVDEGFEEIFSLEDPTIALLDACDKTSMQRGQLPSSRLPFVLFKCDAIKFCIPFQTCRLLYKQLKPNHALLKLPQPIFKMVS